MISRQIRDNFFPGELAIVGRSCGAPLPTILCIDDRRD